jgi:hypothetical protein
VSDADLAILPAPKEDPKPDTARDRLERLISATVQSARERLAAAGKRAMTPAQEFHYEADLRIQARKAMVWEPRKKTKAPFHRELVRQRNRRAERSRARNRK